MMTFASGISIELSPTLERKIVLISVENLKACNTRVRSACEVSPYMSGRRKAVAYSLKAKILSLKTIILSPRCCS